MAGMVIDWDVVEGAGVRKTPRGVDIIRPVIVENVPGDCSTGQNPSVLLNALNAPGMPAMYSSHPDPAYANAVLEEQNVISIGAVDAVRVELIYRAKAIDPTGHTNPDAWTITDATQTSHVITYSAFSGEAACLVWYKTGTPKTANAPPSKSALKFAGLHKINPYRVIKATAILLATDWAAWKADVRAAKGKINSDTWGDALRGTWLFLGPTTKYFDISKKQVQVELVFLEDEKGHFPIVAYLNSRGEHPADCISEAALRNAQTGANHLPLKGQISARNGLSIVSIYDETAFSDLFAFDPSL